MTWGATPAINVTHEGVIPVASFDQDLGAGARAAAACAPASRSRGPRSRSTRSRTGRCTAPPTGTTAPIRRSPGITRSTRMLLRAIAPGFAGTSSARRRGNWAVQNQGTFGPADGLYRWMGSAAMDHDGNLAVGYSIGNGRHRTIRASGMRAGSRATRRTRSARARRSCTWARALRRPPATAGATTR